MLTWMVTLAACNQQGTDFDIVAVVKVDGISWFDRLEEGVLDAGAELGGNVRMIGPAEGDPAEAQQTMIEDLIAEGVDAIAVVPNDAAALEPTLQAALDAGIVVLTHESPDQQNSDWDVETIDNNKFGITFFDSLAEHMGGSGKYALFVGGADLHDYWADRGLAHAATEYPDLELVTLPDDGTYTACATAGTCRTDRVVCGEDSVLAAQATADLLVAYPDLKGIVAFGSQGPLGGGEKLRELGNEDVAIVGVAIPSAAAVLLSEGWIDDGYLWDPKDAGYALVAVATRILDGEEIQSGDETGALGAAVVDAENRDIYFDRTLQVTAENASELGF